jgi:hypothetical protein
VVFEGGFAAALFVFGATGVLAHRGPGFQTFPWARSMDGRGRPSLHDLSIGQGWIVLAYAFVLRDTIVTSEGFHADYEPP